jgi:uncharacterized repeat protein (TIGR01451 family)/CSLREA domain-containing protein
MFQPLPRSRNVRFVSFALALIALTISAALLSHRSSAASSPFNDKANDSKTASQSVSALARTKSGRLSWIFGDPFTAAMPASTTFTVNTTDDHDDGSCDSFDCTLREAINAANSNPGADTITFNISGSGVQTIQLLSQLPTITDSVIIDGYSQPGTSANTLVNGDNAVLLIQIDGINTGANAFGLNLAVGSDGSRIRGLVINRFSQFGILVSGASGIKIDGNFIGTDPSGNSALPNSRDGVQLDNSSNDTIGGTTPDLRNLISGNSGPGLNLNGAGITGTSVLGNYFGTNAAGNVSMGNDLNNVQIVGGSNNTIGGTASGAGNLISGSTQNGIRISDGATGNLVQGNMIGTDRSGSAGLSNHGGIEIRDSSNNTIGGTGPGAGNIVAFNSATGIAVASGIGNGIRQNSIFSNGGLGIDLGGNGVTLNDPCDGDTGANNFQNFPVLTSVSSTAIQGTLNSSANTTFALEFFTNNAGDPSGFGEGQNFVGSTQVTTDANCNANFSLPATISSNQVVTATATDPNGNTSEFSAWRQLDADLSITKTDGQTNVTPGQHLTYTIVVTNNGPGAVMGATVNDIFPPSLIGVSWTCSASIGSSCSALTGAGSINNVSVNLLAGGTATFTANATVSNTAFGTVNNTATVTAPPGVTDPNTGNNSATDSDTVTPPTADLSITKTDNQTTAAAGSAVTYTIVATNNGPANVTGANVTDTFPAGLTNVSWTCTASSGSSCGIPGGGGNINANNVSLLANGTATFIASGTLSATSGTLSNTARVTAPPSVIDPNINNNSATDTDTITCSTVVLNTNNSGAGSLRQAILCANGNLGLDTISFNIPGAGVHTVQPLSPLPSITDPVVLDGYSQPDASPNTLLNGDDAVLTIQLMGGSPGSGASGLVIDAGGSGTTIRGLVINRFSVNQILVRGASGNTISGNFIGTDPTGAGSVSSTGDGVSIAGPSNKVGGTNPAARNVISGNTNRGIIITANGNSVQGNFIGTNRNGTAAVPNLANGIQITGGADNIIGGTTPGAGNLISGNGGFNGGPGVLLYGNTGSSPTFCSGAPSPVTGTLVQGNLIGTDVTGTQAIGNATGVYIVCTASGNLVGGTAAAARNVISGNKINPTTNLFGQGVLIAWGASENLVQGNYIGTDISGTAAVPNQSFGVSIGFGQPDSGAPHNFIGGATPEAGNLISGNTRSGIILQQRSNGNIVQQNLVGTSVSGVSALPNGGNGVSINSFSSGNLIGGTSDGNPGSPSAGNTIANNFNGVSVFSAASDPGPSTGNAIVRNSIFSNGALGIDLGGDGVTPNDACDTDTGANNLQNFPVLTSVSISGGTATIQGTLNSAPNTTFTIEFFANAVADPSGFGEGQTYIGSTTVTTDATCNASFTFTGSVPSGQQVITATATDPGGNTSEFSGVLTNTADLSITKTDGQTSAVPGSQVTYTITVSNAGPSGVTGATVNDNFPASLTNVSWTCTASAGSSCGAASGSGNINTTVNLLDQGSATFTATGTLSRSATGTLDNTATVTPPAGVTDPNTANNSATDSDTITATSDLSITKTGSPNPVTVGGTLTYTITVNNGGPSTATNVTLADTLPASVTFGSATPSQGSCTQSGGTVTCNLGSIADGGSATVTITVTPNAAGTISNTATVSANESDPNSANNTATATTTVIKANTTTTVTSSQNPSTYGQPVTFTATVTAVAPGGGTPTGTVTFYDGTTVLATVALTGSGQATFTTSSLFIGTHSITATYNGDANFNASTSPPLIQTVVTPASTESVKVTGGGFITLTTGGSGSFGLVGMVSNSDVPSGNLEYQDHDTGMNIKSTTITAVVVTGTHARMFGTATVNGAGSFDFVVDVDDLGEPGTGVDTFRIQLSNGYTAGPVTLSGGNIQVHQ